jgi:hypothetical protein
VLGPAELPLADLSTDDLEVKRVYVLGRFQRAGCGLSHVVFVVPSWLPC